MKLCQFCRGSIQGKYWSYSNGVICCSICHQKLPKCNACNIPCQSGKKQLGKTYCRSCCQKTLRCSYCKNYIFGNYLKTDKLNICGTCSQNSKCFRCKIPMRDYLKVGKHKICPACSQQIEHCARCHIPLLEKFFQFPEDSRKFCSNCTQSRKRCDMCSKPLTLKYHQLPDRRRICGDCMKTAVKDPKAAQQILQKVLSYLTKEFQMQVPLSTKFNLVDAKVLAQIRRKNFKILGSKDIRALGMFVRNGNSFDVYVETLLPEALCLGVIAHEYTHAWQANVFPVNTSLLWLEGLAEWISYKALRYHGYSKQAALIPLQKDIYGQGFHKIKEIETKYGSKKVLKQVMEKVTKDRKI